ncbi:putative Chloride channel CLIC-like protein 1 [Hypsibius exemplaris]|uniref:Chloride channel CLIC-like protein 1 n=1 Tax=Hypsibius exemplaris TaxID=2072580 RepID=A0A1W0X5Z0_HYPEX|nr:putative Chloride channel CLIC-like protein 1 [Hypsibius exemplaris]
MKSLSIYIFSVFGSLFVFVSGVEEVRKKSSHFEESDRSNWVDPTAKFDLKKKPNPVGLATGDGVERCHVTEADCRKYMDSTERKNSNDLIMLRHVLRKFVTEYHSTGNTEYDFDVTLRLERPQLEEFERLLDNPNVLHSGPIIDAWNSVLKTLRVQKEPSSIESVERKLGFRLNLIVQCLFIVALPILIIYMETKIRMSLLGIVRRLFQYILLVSFLISFPWTWFRLYQEKVASQQHHLLEKSQAHCEPLSAGQLLKRTFGNLFSMTPEASPCEKYYRAVNVNPFLDVPPTQAIVVTITSFVLEPLKHIGKAFGEFIQAVLSPLPFYMYPFVIVFLLIIAFLLIITQSNYEVHLPWFIGKIRPGGRPTPLKAVPQTPQSIESPRSRELSGGGGGIRKLLEASSESERREGRLSQQQQQLDSTPVVEREPQRALKSVNFKDSPSSARISRRRDPPISISRSDLEISRSESSVSRSPSCPNIRRNRDSSS